VEYTLNLSTTQGGYSGVGLNGSTNIFGGVYNDSNGISNSCTVLVPAGQTLGLYYSDNGGTIVQTSSRITFTLLMAGALGPTGVMGPVGAVSQISYTTQGGSQSITPITTMNTVILWPYYDSTQSTGNTAFSYAAGLFRNNNLGAITVLVEYTLNLITTGGGYAAIGLNGYTALFGGMFNDNNGASNSCTVLVPTGATIGLYYMDNQTTVVATTSRITITVLVAGQQGATGMTGSVGTGPTGLIGVTGYTGPAQWTATGSTGPYNTTLTYSQGFVGIGVGPTGANFLQSNGGATAGTGSITPQYTLDINGSERVNGARLFGDGSAQVSAAAVLDYSTFGQNWVTVSGLSTGSWQTAAMSASGQYQAVAGNGVGLYYSSNYGVTWSNSNIATANNNFTSIAISASGQYMIACVQATNGIYYSNNYGISWTQVSGSGSYNWYQVCISASGQYASAVNLTTAPFYSINYGVTFSVSNGVSNANGYGIVSCSASGQYQIAGINTASIYYSTTYGQSWIASNITNAGNVGYSAMSGSGQYATIVTNANGIFVTSTYGQTWVQVTSTFSGYVLRGIAMTTSGQYQVITGYTGGIYYSTNYGSTWTQVANTSASSWYEVAMSSNGQYCLATIAGGTGSVSQSVTRSPALYSSGNAIVAGTATISSNTTIGLFSANTSLTVNGNGGAGVSQFVIRNGANSNGLFGVDTSGNLYLDGIMQGVGYKNIILCGGQGGGGTVGFVGIGITNPASQLHVHSTSASTDVRINLTDATTGSTASSGVSLIKGAADEYGYLWNYYNAGLAFGTNNVERVRILASGNVGIGTNSPNYSLQVNGNIGVGVGTGAQGIYLLDIPGAAWWISTGSYNLTFYNNSASWTQRFQITQTGNASLTGTLSQGSDRKLKKNINTLTNGLDIISTINPVQYHYHYQDNSEYTHFGMIAQDVQEVFPNVISEIINEKADKNDVFRNILTLNYIEFIPILISAVKEQNVLIQQQQTQINQLIQRLAAAGIA
jgi:hypothetical protein